MNEPHALTFREFLGYIRRDPMMKTRLVVLVGTAVVGLVILTVLAVVL